MEEGIYPRKLEGVGRDDSQFDLRFLLFVKGAKHRWKKEPTHVPNYL